MSRYISSITHTGAHTAGCANEKCSVVVDQRDGSLRLSRCVIAFLETDQEDEEQKQREAGREIELGWDG